MKKFLSLLALVLCSHTKAQYITIPDANFVTYLHVHMPAAMTGNQMDTTNPIITTNTHIILLNYTNIADLTGIQYFKSLDSLIITNVNPITNLSVLPPSLKGLDVEATQLHNLPTLPNTLLTLNCTDNIHLTSLPALPNSLKILNCSSCPLTSLPTLPGSLIQLICSFCSLTTLPALPNLLEVLICYHNTTITSLPTLPNQLTYLDCAANPIHNLPALPNSLQLMNCFYNPLTSLPTLPTSLKYLSVENDSLTSLPALPASLLSLGCGNNQLSIIPALPSTLTDLSCEVNYGITSLPALPSTLQNLYCFYCSLTGLPDLPNGLKILLCDSNYISCFPVFPHSITTLDIHANPFTCLPNYIPPMLNDTITYPLCSSISENPCPLAAISTHSIQNSTLHIYPNPANNKIIIDANDVIDVKLFDMLGKQIFTTKEKNIDVSNFNDGVYFIQAQTNQSTTTQKIIVQH